MGLSIHPSTPKSIAEVRRKFTQPHAMPPTSSSTVSFHLSGTQAVDRRIRRLASRLPQIAARALRREAEAIMTESKRKYVPVDLGTLRSSGHVGEVIIKPGPAGGVEVTLGFGGAAAPYALAIHEVHSPHDPPSWKGVDVNFKLKGRGRKYLEIPLRLAVRGMAERIGIRVQGEIERTLAGAGAAASIDTSGGDDGGAAS
jgi:hypothetical protein